MFIHFAFSSLKDDPDKQLTAVISNILEAKRLMYGVNPEFIPVFQPHLHPKFKGQEVVQIPLESFMPSKEGAVASLNDLRSIKPEHDLYFLSYEIHMLCFIKVPFTQLSKSPHSSQYGRFGLVLSDQFLKKNGIAVVQYYEESSLFADSLVVEWNLKFAYKANLSSNETKEKSELERQILALRKPAALFESFRESRSLAVTKVSEENTSLQIVDAYGRYSIGYDFREEKEWRVISQTEGFLSFTENDLFMVVAPDERCASNLEQYFRSNWEVIPEIRIFPESKMPGQA